MPQEFGNRLRALQRRLNQSGAGALLVTHLPNVYYLSGFTGSAGALVVEPRSATLFTDGRYSVQAREQLHSSGVNASISQVNPLEAAGSILKGLKGSASRRTTILDPSRITVAGRGTLSRAAGRRVKWQNSTGWVEEMRTIKSRGEITKIRAAARLISKVFDQVVKLVRPGITELDLAAEVDYRMRKLGASGPSFDTIIASGPRAALPHAQPTAKRLRQNELVVLDMGAILARYCSDLTRTVYLGRAPRRVKQWYKAVLDAQKAAQEALAIENVAEQPDAAARRVLDSCGLGQYFVHSTGHGLGLEVHEEPRLAKGQRKRLMPGMVVTIEPGVYVEGIGGIRIEDDVAIHAGRIEVLTTAPRELLEL
jgi:Xaa-Pro aminopeptidase